jgi:hypothetical protein
MQALRCVLKGWSRAIDAGADGLVDFAALAAAVTNGDAVVAFFTALVATLPDALATPRPDSLLPDLRELLREFACRFKGALLLSMEAAATLLLDAARSESIYAVEALLPLAAMAIIGRDAFAPFVDPVLGVFTAAITIARDTRALYASPSASPCCSTSPFPTTTRSGGSRCSSRRSPARSSPPTPAAPPSPPAFAPHAAVLLGHVPTYCQDLRARFREDEAVASRIAIATAVASLLPPAMRAIGEAAEEQLAMAADLILFAPDLLAPSPPLSRSNQQTAAC